jgi:hypothetical protein
MPTENIFILLCLVCDAEQIGVVWRGVEGWWVRIGCRRKENEERWDDEAGIRSVGTEGGGVKRRRSGCRSESLGREEGEGRRRGKRADYGEMVALRGEESRGEK